MSSSSILRWGIASCGLISHDFCHAINMLKNQGHKIAAVAARDLGRAERFGDTHGVEKCYGSYEQLIEDPNVDVVYVGSVHTTHYDIARMSLSGNKHVVCEKPMTLSYRDTRSLVDLAKGRKRFFMEGIWSRCTPVYDRVRQELNAGTLGTVHSVIATFCIPLVQKFSTVTTKDLGSSSLLTTGTYPLQLANMVFGRNPTKRTFVGHKMEPQEVDDYTSIVLQYESGQQVAHMICDGRYQSNRNYAIISGSNGNIRIGSPFWAPLEVDITTTGATFGCGGEVKPGQRLYKYDLPGGEQMAAKMNHINSANFVFEIQHVRECILKGYVESDLVPHDDSLHIADLMDDALNAVGVRA